MNDLPGPRADAATPPGRLAGRRVLLLNWRDSDHPRAGGAEVYCEEIGARLVREGAQVTLFTARHRGAAATEHRRGVTIVREGGEFGVYARAARFLRRTAGAYDAVLDCQNGIPFFAPLFAGRRTAVVCVIHHVHQEQFALHFPWPASRIGQVLEGPVSRHVYGDRPLVAVSPSTRHDVRRRLGLRGPIHVVPNGLTPPPGQWRRRSDTPHIVVVSRLVKHKRFDLLIDSLPTLRQRWPHLRVDVAGDGPERADLLASAQRQGLADVVTFHGFVSDARRAELLASAWLTVAPSQAEGWGLTVLEANVAGVPALAHDVPGLRDSVVDGETGWLVPLGTTLDQGIDTALEALTDPVTSERISAQCRSWAARFSWDRSAARLANLLAGEIDRVRRGAKDRRTRSDLSVRVEAGVDDDTPSARLAPERPVLRRTDEWTLDEREVRLLLHGCDETGAELVLRRLGARGPASIGPASGADLLTGAS